MLRLVLNKHLKVVRYEAPGINSRGGCEAISPPTCQELKIVENICRRGLTAAGDPGDGAQKRPTTELIAEPSTKIDLGSGVRPLEMPWGDSL